MISKIIKLFRKKNNLEIEENNKNSIYEKYLNLIIDFQIGDKIRMTYYDLDDKYHIELGRLYAFDDIGNISILTSEYKNEYFNINIINDVISFDKIQIINYTLENRINDLKMENERMKAEKIKNGSSEFQERLIEYRKEFIRLQLEDNNLHD